MRVVEQTFLAPQIRKEFMQVIQLVPHERIHELWTRMLPLIKEETVKAAFPKCGTARTTRARAGDT